MADNTTRGRLAYLEAEVSGMKGDIGEIKDDVKTMLAALAEYKGRNKFVSWLLTLLAGSSIVGWAAEHFGTK